MASKSPRTSPRSAPAAKAQKASDQIQASTKARVNKAAESVEQQVTVDISDLSSRLSLANGLLTHLERKAEGKMEWAFSKHGLAEHDLELVVDPTGEKNAEYYLKRGIIWPETHNRLIENEATEVRPDDFPYVLQINGYGIRATPVLKKNGREKTLTFVLRTELVTAQHDALGADYIIEMGEQLKLAKSALPGSKEAYTEKERYTDLSFQVDLDVPFSDDPLMIHHVEGAIRTYIERAFPKAKIVE